MTLTDFKNTHFLLVLLTITICFCCRSQPENELLCTKVVACAQGAATATGCTLEWVSISATQ